MKAKVIVIGGNHHNTLSMVRSLGQASFMVDVIIEDSTPNECYVTKSKYINRSFFVQNESDIIDLLCNYYSCECYKSIIITCTDTSASVLDRNFDLIEKYFYFFNARAQGRITEFLYKKKQVQLASELGICTPKTLVYKVGDNFPEGLFYPCLIKPLSSTLLAKRADICHNSKELQEIIKEYPEGSLTVIQQYIKRDYEIAVDGLSIGDEVIIPGFVQKIRDNINGGSSFTLSCHINELPEELVEKMKLMVKKIGYEGLFGYEFIVSNGNYYFVEINLRNDATTYSLVKAGVNLPAMYVKTKEQGTFIPPNCLEIKKILSMSEIADFGNSLKQYHLSIRQWIRDLKESECLFIYDKEDKRPFKKAWQIYIKNQIIKRIKKK